jgi:hypothetical protein
LRRTTTIWTNWSPRAVERFGLGLASQCHGGGDD